MHGDDERDPVDDWLDQQVRPLPPPPGTFELITRRARRRKVGKLAVTVASAAAVAAAVAVAVPGGLVLHISPSPTVSGLAAGGQPRPSSSAGTQQPNGTASRYESPKPTIAQSVTQPAAIIPLAPVPGNFQPSSVTFVDNHDAWVIGQAGTPGHCADANPYICTSIVRTGNAGRTWSGAPAPKTGAPHGATGVSGIRFLDGVNGWAFGPELWATHDSGKTWAQVGTGGQRVTDLETANGRAYALWATCSGASATGFASDCTSFTLMTTTADSDNWAPAGSQTSGLGTGGKATSAVIALTGSVGYLLAPDGTLFSGPIGGSWQQVGTAPCQPRPAMTSGLPADAWFAAASPTSLAIVCQGTAASAEPIYTSADGGASWMLQPRLVASIGSDPGPVTSLSAAPNGTLVLATTRGIFVRPAGATAWRPANATGPGMPSGGFSYVGMTFNDQGVALPADTSLHEVWMTFDGGQTWKPVTPILPGR